jgi:thioesterase domain-containing protein
MVPSAVMVLPDGLPLTANGKLDRAALPAPGHPARGGRPATSPLEKLLCGAFAEVLGLDHVGTDDSFFALGGHSMLAARLTALLHDRGITLSVRTLFAAPTVAGLITHMHASSVQDALGVLLPIRSTGTRPPIFCMHPAGGPSWCYMPLARHVPADIPLYGLQSPGLDGTGDLPGSLREMAAAYLRHIRAVQPVGPYYLLGWSFGGLTAHEIAVQLQAAGDQAVLIIMDIYPDNQSPAPEDHEPWIPAWASGHLPGALSEEEYQRLAGIMRNSRELLRTHQPGTFDGQALLLSAAHEPPGPLPPAERWRPYITGHITEVPLACNHNQMCQPANLARAWPAISAWLDPDS